MKTSVLAILGLGLMGGSVAASLKSRGLAWRVKAYDRRRPGLDLALRKGMIDEIADCASDAVQGADVVLLATPVGTIRSLLKGLAPHFVEGQLVTDVGSTKGTIVAEAAALPPGVDFVGGHPMVGTERSGPEAAVAGLFEGRRCILTPTAQSRPEAVERITQFWNTLGAQVTVLSPEVHDAFVARLSHVPNLLAYTLVNAVAMGIPPYALELSGGALRDMTRVAKSSPTLWRDVCVENRPAISAALEEFSTQLRRLREAVDAADGDALEKLLRAGNETRSIAWKL